MKLQIYEVYDETALLATSGLCLIVVSVSKQLQINKQFAFQLISLISCIIVAASNLTKFVNLGTKQMIGSHLKCNVSKN